MGQWEWGKREGVRGQGGVRERGGGEVHSSFVGMHRPWARIGRGWGVVVVRGRALAWFVGTHGSWARMGRGRAWVVGAHGSWACMGRGRAWVVGTHWSWPRIRRGHVSVGGGIVVGRARSSCMGGGLLCLCVLVIHVEGCCCPWVGHCHLWVEGRGVILVPGHCRLGVICGCWVLLMGVGCPL